MARSLLFSQGNATQGTVRKYWPIGSGPILGGSTTESIAVQTTLYSAGTLTNLYVYVQTNSTASSSTHNTRKNGTADGNLSVSIPAATTGQFVDTANSDTVTAGDEWGTTGLAPDSTYRPTIMALTYSVSGKAVSCLLAQMQFTTADAQFYRELSGPNDANFDATENDVEYTTKEACTLRNGAANVTTNSIDGTSTLRSRVGGANGNILVSITANTTGLFEDASNSDSVASGTTINWSYVHGSGTGSVVGRFIVDYESAGGRSLAMAGHGATTSAADEFYFVGDAESATEAIKQNRMLYVATGSNLQINVYANTMIGNATAKSRKNTADGSQAITILTLTTGVLVDDVNTDTLAVDDEYGYMIDEEGSSGTITLGQFSSLILDANQVAATSPKFFPFLDRR